MANYSLSRASVKRWVLTFFSVFGVLAAVNGVVNTVYSETLKMQGLPYLISLFALAAVCATIRSWPRRKIRVDFKVPSVEVVVKVGDLFAQPTDLVIGMSDTFDTETPELIQQDSVQGQFLKREYDGEVNRLDRDLDRKLNLLTPEKVEERRTKLLGKLRRFPIGTVVTLGAPGRRRYCVAYSKMSNEPKAQSSPDELWLSLSSLWAEVRAHGQLAPVSMPIVGSGLARLNSQLTRTDLVQLIVLSFLTASRSNVITRSLTIIVSKSDARDVDFPTIRQALKSTG